jgi:hypothetical protein
LTVDFLFSSFQIAKIATLAAIITFVGLAQTVAAQGGVEDPSAFSSDPLWLTSSIIDPNCEVDIRGDSPIMYPGNFTNLYAEISGVIPEGFAWAVEPDIIKDYDDRVFENGLLSEVDPVTQMVPSDFQKSSISFYWKPEADTNRTVAVRVLTEDGICEDAESYTVAIGNTSDTQPEDFYVASNHLADPPSTRTLQEHLKWHETYAFETNSYNEKGDLFFKFHKLYLAHFDAFRAGFGYPPIEVWDPGTKLPDTIDVTHSPRNESFVKFDYSLLDLPSWFKPLGNGTVERTPDTYGMVLNEEVLVELRSLDPEEFKEFINRNFQQDDFPPDIGVEEFINSPILPCERADAPSVSWPDRTQDSLNDFESDKELLGCALTHPYHNLRHGAVGGNDGDMSYPERAPLDPIFWRLHKFIDSISVAHDGLTPVALTGNVSIIDAARDDLGSLEFVGNVSMLSEAPLTLHGLTPLRGIDNISESTIIDRAPPQIEFQNPQTVVPFITEMPELSDEEAESLGFGILADQEAISVIFNEPVTDVIADDLTINESPATTVNGQGAGPFIFTGFKPPETGTVNVTLSSGNIQDISGNLFQGESWNYTLSKRTNDNDNDDITNGLEINQFLTDPTIPDTDGDSIPDGFETKSPCLNALLDDSQVKNFAGKVVNSTGRDFDRDGMTNVEEFQLGTSPCS